MPTAKGELIKKINSALGCFCWEIELNGFSGMFDEHKNSEDFFKDLLNIIFSDSNYSLENLNFTDKINFPGVDLGDEKNGLAIQVTSNANSKKIDHTIECFLENKLYDKYGKLNFLVIGKRGKSNKKYDTKGKFQFEYSSDVLDLNYLTKKISGLSLGDIEKTHTFLESNLSYLKSRTSEPIRLSDKDIKNLILSIKDVIKDEIAETQGAYAEIPIRDDDFMSRKNDLNGVEDDYYVNIIEKNIKYQPEIYDFLADPINGGVTKCYLSVQQELQVKYLNNRDQFESITDFFEYIYDRVAEKFEKELGYDKRKITVMLHYMYFNCDLGVNPK